MIVVTSIRDLSKYPATTKYAVVRSLKNQIKDTKQLAVLSPSPNLFHAYLNWKQAGRWNQTMFDTLYAPWFLQQIAKDPAAISALNDLWFRSKNGEEIVLACYCPNESLCHRSILAGLLQGAGAEVQTLLKQDYRRFYDQFFALRQQLERS